MLSSFRRQRLLAALLLLANPALVGSWVAAYHPCPIQSGVQRHSGAAAPVHVAEHAEHEGMLVAEVPAPAHGHDQDAEQCTCIGQCLTSGIALPSFDGDETRPSFAVTQHTAPRTQHTLALPASVPLDLLPPSTAPPIA